MEHTRWARRIFRGAAIYGFIVVPLMLMAPLPKDRPELLFGFVGLALVFQAMFWMIGGDPLRWRTLMPFGAAEKIAFGLPALILSLRGLSASALAFFAAIDLVLALAFVLAWHHTSVQRPA